MLADTSWIVDAKSPALSCDFPDTAWPSGITLDMTFIPRGDAMLVIDMAPFFLWLNDSMQPACICQSLLGNTVAQNTAVKIHAGQENTLRMTCADGRLEAQINGETIGFGSDYKPQFNRLGISWHGHCDIDLRHLNLTTQLASLTQSTAPPPVADRFKNQMTFDFYDDIIPSPCTRERLDDMMKRVAEQGYEQVNWVYHGSRHDGFWDPTGSKASPDDHVEKTFAELGDNDLCAATQAAHKFGLRIHAIIKPFDLSIRGNNFPLGSPLAKQFGKNSVLGGQAYHCFNFVAQHPELCMRRRVTKPASPAANSPIQRIVIEPWNRDATLPTHLELWVSDDNWKYKRYTEPYEITTTNGRCTIAGLNITAPFFAVRVPGHEGANHIRNAMNLLMRVIDADGSEVPFTYGLHPRTYWQHGDTPAPHLEREYDPGLGFSEEGFFFDALQAGIPSSLWCGDKYLYHHIALDNANGVLGFAIGHNPYIPGVMCPSEPGARKFWNQFITDALDCGVDGINLRVSNHADVIQWREYGFNEPMLQAYQERYATDATNIIDDPLAMARWRTLRGEFYTQFLEEASKTIRHRNKAFALHISDLMQGTPDASTMMEMHWDWPTWIHTLRPDQVTLKLISENNYRSHHAREVISTCNQFGIPVILCAFLHSIQERINDQWAEYFAELKSLGLSGFDVYEYATCFVNNPDGSTTTLLDVSPYLNKTT